MAAMQSWRQLQFLMYFIFLVIVLLGGVYSADPLSDCGRANEKPKTCVILTTSSQNQVINVMKLGGDVERLMTFCYPGQERQWYHLWINPRLILVRQRNQDMVYVYSGANLTDVRSNHASHLAHLWSYLLVGNTFSFHPFNASCLGLASTQSYTVDFKIRNPDPWLMAYVAIGIFLFFSARKWSRSITLHYTSGVTLGVIASILIVVFIVSRLLPQRMKSLATLAMAVSSSLSLCFMYYIGQNLTEFLKDHWQLALGYVLVAGLISFGLVYRYGPITDPRSLNLVHWSLQGIGLVLIFNGFQIPEVAVAVIVVVLSVYNFPRSIFGYFRRLRWRLKLFVPKRRLLTEEEYYLQGEVETRKALEELRYFCQSPKCDAWRVVSRLQTPSRFASFIEGESHLSDDEISEHDRYGEMVPIRQDDLDDSELDFRLGNYHN